MLLRVIWDCLGADREEEVVAVVLRVLRSDKGLGDETDFLDRIDWEGGIETFATELTCLACGRANALATADEEDADGSLMPRSRTKAQGGARCH